jgi:hypothetical protein
MAEPQSDGLALKEHLVSIYRQTGQLPDELANAPALPGCCAGLWGDFLDLHQSRDYRDYGPAPITYRDLDAWQNVTRARLAPWEIAAIKRADREFLKIAAQRKPRTSD